MKLDVKTHPQYSYVKIVSIPFNDIEKIDFSLCKQPTETPDAYYKRQTNKPDLITNGGFFAMSNGVTCFSYKDEGSTIVSTATVGWDMPGVAIYGNKSLQLVTMDTSKDCRDFCAAYPVLVSAGKAATIKYATEINYNARRTCIGWNDSTYFVVTVDSPGLTYSKLQKIFLDLGATYAINLDGGGSTRMLVDGKLKTAESYARPVDTVMCVYLKKQSKESVVQEIKTIYRVQVGAFLSKQNAENLQAELKKLGFTDSFIRKIGNAYKVQLGAFSVKLNAERLKDRLVALGYNPFITT